MRYEEFEIGYKNLCEAYGKRFTKEQCRVYFDDIGPRIDLSQWGGVVRAWRRSSETFPKICELVVATSGEKKEDVEDPMLAWLNGDCQVKECVDGLIPVLWPDGGVPVPILTMTDEATRMGPGSELSLGCPRCRRYKTFIPRMREYHGTITLRTQEEMDARRKERLAICGRAAR